MNNPRTSKPIVLLAAVQGLVVFIAVSGMRFMPENNWFWDALLVLLLSLWVTQIALSIHWFSGRRCLAAVAGSVGFTVFGLPVVAFAGFLLSLVIGTFVFPPR